MINFAQWRDTHLNNLAVEIGEETGQDPEQVYRSLFNNQKVKEHFKSIRGKEKRGQRSGVDRVDVTTSTGLVTVVDKEEIEAAIISANKEKLLQARDTPLRQEPLRTIIGERMQYDEWEKVLRKEISIPENLEEGTRLWFEAIQNFQDDPIEIDWTSEEYFRG